MPRFSGRRLDRIRASRQYRDGSFRNRTGVQPGLQGNPLPVLADLFLKAGDRRPPGPIPIDDPKPLWTELPASGLRVTWLGHSAVLLEIDGARVLIDPMFDERASPLPFLVGKRFHPVPVTIAELPPLDAIVLSHDHYDHLGADTIRALAALRVPMITSLGVGARLERFGWDPQLIVELDWWEAHTLAGSGVRFTATPAQHFSGRGLIDRNATLWSSWVIATAQHRVFFSGDTGLNDDLITIGEQLGPFDLSMIEIGAADPAWVDIHLGPERAMRAFEMLGEGTLLPIHWATFDLALHKWAEPAEAVLRMAEASGAKLITPRIGQPVEPSAVATATPWWRDIASGSS